MASLTLTCPFCQARIPVRASMGEVVGVKIEFEVETFPFAHHVRTEHGQEGAAR